MSDQRFTEQFIFSKKNKYGVEKIRYELKMRGVDETIINGELVKIKSENYSLAKKIWAKKFDATPHSQEERNKQIRFLQGRGINIEIIHKILSGKNFE